MKRIILHLDMDSYFASVEQQARPLLRGKPIGITGRPTDRSIITAFSREAKRNNVQAGMPAWEALEACPNLILVPGNPERYMSITKRFVEILKAYTSMIEVFSVDEVFMDVTQEAPLRGGPVRMAQEIQASFRTHLGPCITATIGIAGNKAFAKLIGKRHKPNGIGVLMPGELPRLLDTTPVEDLCGIGPRIGARLSRVGIRTLAELGATPATFLKREFGVYGLWLHQVGQGSDPTPLLPYTEIPAPKSVGHSKSLPPEMRSMPVALCVLRDLCDNVGRRMRRLGYMGRTVHCGFRTGSIGPHTAKQTTLALPTDDGEAIYKACLIVLEKIPVKPDNVSNVSVSVGKLCPREQVSGFLLDFDRQREQLNHAVDRIRDRYGAQAIRLGTSLLLKPIPQHVGGFLTPGEDRDFS